MNLPPFPASSPVSITVMSDVIFKGDFEAH